MAVVVVGMHEWDAPLETFEKVAVAEGELGKALAELVGSPHLSEAVVLSTCMRTEVYAVLERFHDGLGDVETFFSSRLGTAVHLAAGLAEASELRAEPPAGSFDLGMLSCWYDDAAVAHLFEVAAGIDSPVLGEGEVLRQVRDAAEHARVEFAAGPVLTPLFRHAVEAGKRARTETAIQRGSLSLAGAAVELAARAAGGLGGRRVLLIGAGEMATGVARLLSGRANGPAEVAVANRGASRAGVLAEIVGGRATGLDDLEAMIGWSDVVITSTGSEDFLLGADLLSAVISRREPARLPLVVIDAAVPRDVEGTAAGIGGLVLHDVEDVRRHVSEQAAGREREVSAVRELLAEELRRYKDAAAGRTAAPVVSALRARAEDLRLAELDHYAGRLAELAEPERDLVETLTRRIVAKLLHEPTVRVKDAAGSPRGERLAEALRTLFDL